MKLVFALLSILSSAYLVLKAPQLQNTYLRYRVGSAVVEVLKMDASGRALGGGTGFQVKAPNGDKYIITNAHVCDMYKGEKMANIQLRDGNIIKSEILSISDETDLCAIKGIPGLSSVSLASSVSVGERIATVGHPHLLPLDVSWGDILGQSIVQVGLGLIGADIPEGSCNLPKNKIVNIDFFGFPIAICTEEVNAYQTTSVTLPGNSGSPVVNWRGQVIGVLFAGDNDVHWGMVIPLNDLRDFLINL